MKVIFVGPSLHGSKKSIDANIRLRPPAMQGDVARAVREGANVIGLIDGVYEHVAAVWHKEIMFALSEGVQVYGAASIGALRAAECSFFGMVGLGEIFRAFLDGHLLDDAEVAVLHGPKELNYLPLSEPLINVRVTVECLATNGYLSSDEHDQILEAAKHLFFKQRTWKSILATTTISETRAQQISAKIRGTGINQKLTDAEQLIDAVEASNDTRVKISHAWEFSQTSQFDRWLTAK